VTRIGKQYPGGKYMPGGRDWQFRAPRLLEVALTVMPSARVRQWMYGHWPVQPRQTGTVR
jgi:hypothetical protein